jgi:hypothetical protein
MSWLRLKEFSQARVKIADREFIIGHAQDHAKLLIGDQNTLRTSKIKLELHLFGLKLSRANILSSL